MSVPRIEYEEINELHRGGFARLALAQQSDGTRIVVRELLPGYLFRWRIRRAFVRGTRIREQLGRHPNIIYSLEHGIRHFRPYEILEYIDGMSLRRLMQNRENALTQNAVEILRQAAMALTHVHSLGFIHLDIKPENFVVCLNDNPVTVKLTDFDLTVHAQEHHWRTPAGTMAYLAPEQIRNEAFGPAADIFAFGIVAYQLVTGRMPFVAKNKRKLLWAQTSQSYKVKTPLELNPDLSPKLDWIIMKCLEKHPADRFPSMAYLCQELSRY